jgi:CRP-like cAMP-binding protein
MAAERSPERRDSRDSIVTDAIRQTWPTASEESLARLIHGASLREELHGTIVREAERPSPVALVVHGTVVAYWSAPDGRILYGGLFGRGQLWGLPSLNGGASVVGIDAVTTVSVITWRSELVRAIAEVDAAFALALLDRALFAIQALNRMNKLRSFTTAGARLAGLLLEYEALCFGPNAPLVARRHLAAMAGVTPEMASRILRRWEAASIVRRARPSGLELLDREALRAQAEPLAAFPRLDPTSRGAWAAPEAP